jgi:RNA polymerase sigma-32 factor
MSEREPVEIDPEVLEDPVDGGDEGEPSPAGAPGQSLVPRADRGLAPADPFRRYLAEIRKYPPLDRDEERDLARRYRDTGDKEALLRLITSNLMVVVRIALSFRRAAKNLLDLVQEGNVGLMQAIDRFDPELGVRLPTYAAWWIRAYMIKFLLDNVRLVRVGTTNARRKLLRNLRKEQARLESMGFDVGPKLLAERMGVSEEDVVEVQKALTSHDVSLDAPVGDDEEGHRHADRLPDEHVSVEAEVARKQLQEQVERAIASFRDGLDERDAILLDRLLLSEEPWTLQEVGDRFGVTREAIRQAENRLKDRLREHLTAELGDVGSVMLRPDGG